MEVRTLKLDRRLAAIIRLLRLLPKGRGRFVPALAWLAQRAPSPWFRIPQHSIRMTYNGTMRFQLFMALDCYERWMEGIFRAVLSPGGTFVDVGAQIGYTAVCAGRLLRPKGRLVLIEPDERALPQLRDHARQLQGRGLRVDLLELAASDRERELPLLLDDVVGHARLMELGMRSGAPSTPVAAVPLDELLGRLDATVDLLKIDAEGHELQVLRGARRLLESGMIGNILLEYNSPLLMREGYFGSHIAALLEDAGFLGVRVEEGARVTARPPRGGRERPVLENWLFSRDADVLQRFLPETLHPMSAFSSQAEDWRRQCLEEVSEPAHPEVLARRLLESMDRITLGEACAAGEELLAANPEHWLRGHLAHWYKARGDSASARRHLEVLVRQRPEDGEARDILSRL